MNKKKNIVQIILCVCCIAVVVGIITVKAKDFSAVEPAPAVEPTVELEQEETPTEIKEHENSEIAEVPEKKADTSGKKTKIHEDTMYLGEENEDCGVFFTLQPIKVEEAKDADGKNIYRYTMRCHVKSGCKGEVISMKTFADHFSIEIGSENKQAVLVSGKKKLAYKEKTDLKMVVDYEAATLETPENYKVFYTTKEEDDTMISLFRTEYVTGK